MIRFGVSYGGDSITRWIDTGPRAIDCVEVAAEHFFGRAHNHLAVLHAFFLIVNAASLSPGTPDLAPTVEASSKSLERIRKHPSARVQPGRRPLSRRPFRSVPVAAVVSDHLLHIAEAARPTDPEHRCTAVPGTIRDTLEPPLRADRVSANRRSSSVLVASRTEGPDPKWLTELEAARRADDRPDVPRGPVRRAHEEDT
jgi:hypothetical protein